MERKVGIRIEGDSKSFVAATGQAEAASRKLQESTQVSAAGMRHAAVSAGQYQAAMRMLPAQVTDITTSLASGMPVWMVAIQQGGQIRDSFGGWEAAGRGVISMLSPLKVGVGAAAAAAAAGALAYRQGQRELEEYHRWIILTGNAAGVTAGQVDAAARRIASGGTFTQGAAAGVLSQMLSTGDVSRAQLESATRAALELQRSLGVEVEKTVRAFSMMGDKPLEGAVKVNEQYRFLTLEVYNQIKALQKRGDVDQAGAVAQNEFARVAQQRAKEMEAQLGTLEKAWRGVREGAAKAWDAMLGVGRQNTLEQELADIDKRLEAPVRRGGNPLQAEARRQALVERRDAIKESLRLAQRAAALQAERLRLVDGQVARDRAGASDEEPLGAIRTAREQYRSDFLRSERGAYGANDAAARREAEEAAKARERFEREDMEVRRREFEGMLREQQQQQQQIESQRRAAEQQLVAGNRASAIANIADPRARAQAQLAAEEEAMRERLRIEGATAEERQRISEELATWRVNRERQLTEDLKPEWQRMLEAWSDTTRQMSAAMDSTWTASLRAGEDAWTRWAMTGKLSARSLGDAIAQEVARASFRQFIGVVAKYLFGGGGLSIDPDGLGIPDNGKPRGGDEYYSAPQGAGGGRAGILAAGGGERVTIINQSGMPLEGQASRAQDGSLQILLSSLKSSIAGDIANGEGAITSAMRGRFGLRDSFGSA